MTTFSIRLTAIKDNYKKDNDKLLYRRELSRLEIDLSRMLRVCDEDTEELEELLNHIWRELDALQ
jgi:hypothetical protein